MSLLLFNPPTSLVDPAFWSHIAHEKVTKWKLKEPEVELQAVYKQNRVRIDTEQNSRNIKGIIQNFNTIEAFKAVDHKKYLADRKDKDIVCILFADLKVILIIAVDL
jgi:hypothetical protein